MTTIASTTQDTTSTAYAGVNKSGGSGSTYAQQEAEASGEASSNATTSQTGVDSRPSTITVNFQGKLLTLHRLDAILEPINVAELPEERYQSFMEGTQRHIEAQTRMLESKYTQWPESPDFSNYAGNKPYATVMVGRNVVATIDNQGVVGSMGGLSSEILDSLPGDVNGTNGPDLAQARAERIAAMVGGRVLKEPSAMTQRQFDALPPIKSPQPTIDYGAMKSDPMYERLQQMMEQFEHTKQMRAEYLAQQQTGIEALA